jgi:hypothetical protein
MTIARLPEVVVILKAVESAEQPESSPEPSDEIGQIQAGLGDGVEANRPLLFLEEQPELLARVYEMARDKIGPRSSDKLDCLGGERLSDDMFLVHERESYDCHSFVLALMRHEFGIAVVETPHHEVTPEEIEHRGSLRQALLYQLYNRKGPIVEDYDRITREFFENILANSECVLIKPFSYTSMFEEKDAAEDTAALDAAAKDNTRQAIEAFRSNLRSSYILISTYKEGRFIGVHSLIVLGLDSSGEDLLVLQKPGIGDAVQISNLSSVVKKFSANVYYGDSFRFNLCNRPLKEMYPAS